MKSLPVRDRQDFSDYMNKGAVYGISTLCH